MSFIATLKQRLFRWHSDGSATFTLGQRRVFIVPSAGGLRFGAMLVVMLLGAINYNLALGHALVFLLTGLGLTGMVHTFRNLYGLNITPGRCEPVFAGETAHFPLTLGNDRGTPRLALELVATGGAPVTAAVDRKNSAKINLPVTAPKRGWLELPRVRLSTVYPLGLFTAWSYLHPEMRCLVYPQPIARPLPPPSPSPRHGELRGDGGDADFSGFRERQPADSPRHVAWKQSARRDAEAPLLVKQFSGGAEEELMLSWQQCESGATIETRLGILAAWVLAADGAGLRYGLEIPGEIIPPGSGDGHRQHCLRALALYPS